MVLLTFDTMNDSRIDLLTSFSFSVYFPTKQDHVTLLLSCYTKVKNDTQINALLDAIALNPHAHNSGGSGGSSGGGSTGKGGASKQGMTNENSGGNDGSSSNANSIFNPEQAISILSSAGYTGKQSVSPLLSYDCCCVVVRHIYLMTFFYSDLRQHKR